MGVGSILAVTFGLVVVCAAAAVAVSFVLRNAAAAREAHPDLGRRVTEAVTRVDALEASWSAYREGLEELRDAIEHKRRRVAASASRAAKAEQEAPEPAPMSRSELINELRRAGGRP